MKIERVQLFQMRLPLVRPYETSGYREEDMVPILVRVEGEGAVGWGECVAFHFPWYSYETNTTAWHVLVDFLVPRLLGRGFPAPQDVAGALADVSGHPMAKAALEMACWDLAAKQRGVPLKALLGGTRDAILSGAAVGLEPTVEEILEKVARERAAGYLRVKVKIRPGMDEAIARRVREAFPDLDFMLDANSAYSLADAPLFERLDAYRPMMLEQPLADDDLVDHAELQRRIRTPVCLDESIRSADDARKAIAIGACRIVNVKPARVGGHREAKRVHDVCAERGVPVWCGGMLETGIGRAHNVHLASLPNFCLPGDVAASERYFVTEVIGEPFRLEPNGTIRVPTGPGIGVTVLEDVVRRLALERAELRG